MDVLEQRSSCVVSAEVGQNRLEPSYLCLIPRHLPIIWRNFTEYWRMKDIGKRDHGRPVVDDIVADNDCRKIVSQGRYPEMENDLPRENANSTVGMIHGE